ncbi:MAG TPA: hypothetical protein VF780_05765 [Nitrosospira sp.]
MAPPPVPTGLDLPPAATTGPAPAATEEPPKKGPGRPKKETKTVAPPAVPTGAPTPAAPAFVDPFAVPGAQEAPAVTYTRDEVMSALKEISAVRTGDMDPTAGARRVYDVLQRAGKLNNVAEIKPEHYLAIMREAGFTPSKI